jgi:hypothetical protein
VDPGPGPRPLRRPVAIAAYLGKRDQFDRSISDFAQRYADQNEQGLPGIRQGNPIQPPGSPRRRLKVTAANRLIMTKEALWTMPHPTVKSSSTDD